MGQKVEREHHVEGLVLERQLAGVGLHQLDHRRAALSSLGEHLRGDVDQRHVVPLGQGRREAAVATSDVEDTQPGAVDPVQHRLPLALVEVVERIGRILGAEVPAVALAKVAAGRALVERLELSDDRVHVVGAGLLPGRVDGPLVRCGELREQRVGQRVGVARRDESPGTAVLDQLRKSTRAARDQGDAERHRLEGDVAEALPV